MARREVEEHGGVSVATQGVGGVDVMLKSVGGVDVGGVGSRGAGRRQPGEARNPDYTKVPGGSCAQAQLGSRPPNITRSTGLCRPS